MITPTSENYYTPDIGREYISNSQIKRFFGCPGKKGCEAAGMAELRGEWKTETTDAMKFGSYVDAYFDNSLPEFLQRNPDMFQKNGSLYAKYEHANTVIQTAQADPLFMWYLQGERQSILTGKIFGQNFIGKPDRVQISEKDDIIVDLKVMKDMESIWCGEYGRLNFIDAWGLSDQLAIYQELLFQKTGKKALCFLAVLTKEPVPDKAIIYVPNGRLEASMLDLELKVERIAQLKSGQQQPVRCEKCDYCKSTKVLKDVIHYNDL